MLQSLSFLVISVMFYCSLSFCKIVPQTLYQRLYQSHVTFTPDPLSGNTKLSSQNRPRSTILLRLPPVIIWKVQTCREAIKRDMCLNIGGRRFQRLPGVKCLNVCQTTSVLKIKMISISDINFSFKKSHFFPSVFHFMFLTNVAYNRAGWLSHFWTISVSLTRRAL